MLQARMANAERNPPERPPAAMPPATQVRNMSDSRGLDNFAYTGFIALIGGRFSRGGNILSARALQDLLGFLRPLRIVRMNGQENPAIFDAAFVSLGFVLRDSHADQSTRKAAYRSTDAGTCKGRHNRAGGYEWPQSRNREGTDTE